MARPNRKRKAQDTHRPAQHGALRQLGDGMRIASPRRRGRRKRSDTPWDERTSYMRLFGFWGYVIIFVLVVLIGGAIWLAVGHYSLQALHNRPLVIPTMAAINEPTPVAPRQDGVRELIPGTGTQTIAQSFQILAYFGTLPLVTPANPVQVIYHQADSPTAMALVPQGFDVSTPAGKQAADDALANPDSASTTPDANQPGGKPGADKDKPAKAIPPVRYTIEHNLDATRPLTSAATCLYVQPVMVGAPVSGTITKVATQPDGTKRLWISSAVRPALNVVISGLQEVQGQVGSNVQVGVSVVGTSSPKPIASPDNPQGYGGVTIQVHPFAAQ